MSKDHRYNKDDWADGEDHNRQDPPKDKSKKTKHHRDKRKRKAGSSFDFEDLDPNV